MKNLFYLLFTLALLFSCEDASTDDFVSDKNKDSDSEKPLTCDEIDGLQITNLDEVPNDYTGAAILCEDGKMTLIYSYDLCNTGSLSHLWGFSTSGIMGYDKNGEGIWKMCKDEGKLMGMAPEGHYDEDIYRMLNTCIDYKNFKF